MRKTITLFALVLLLTGLWNCDMAEAAANLGRMVDSGQSRQVKREDDSFISFQGDLCIQLNADWNVVT